LNEGRKPTPGNGEEPIDQPQFIQPSSTEPVFDNTPQPYDPYQPTNPPASLSQQPSFIETQQPPFNPSTPAPLSADSQSQPTFDAPVGFEQSSTPVQQPIYQQPVQQPQYHQPAPAVPILQYQQQASLPANAVDPFAYDHQAIANAQKACKHAMSCIQFDDIANAVGNLEKAIELLKPFLDKK
jgi:hypothetical protein